MIRLAHFLGLPERTARRASTRREQQPHALYAEMDAETRAGMDRGRVQERRRCGAIIDAAMAAGNPALGIKLATESTLSVEEARAIIAATPRRVSLAEKMARFWATQPRIGMGGPDGTAANSTAAIQASWDASMRRVCPDLYKEKKE